MVRAGHTEASLVLTRAGATVRLFMTDGPAGEKDTEVNPRFTQTHYSVGASAVCPWL